MTPDQKAQLEVRLDRYYRALVSNGVPSPEHPVCTADTFKGCAVQLERAWQELNDELERRERHRQARLWVRHKVARLASLQADVEAQRAEVQRLMALHPADLVDEWLCRVQWAADQAEPEEPSEEAPRRSLGSRVRRWFAGARPSEEPS